MGQTAGPLATGRLAMDADRAANNAIKGLAHCRSEEERSREEKVMKKQTDPMGQRKHDLGKHLSSLSLIAVVCFLSISAACCAFAVAPLKVNL